jgi:hypothetical protein
MQVDSGAGRLLLSTNILLLLAVINEQINLLVSF